jgi:hypothetical protein
VVSGQEGGAVGRADGSGGIGVSKTKALLGQFIEVRSFVKGVPVAPKFSPTEVVGKNEDDVRLAVCG